MDKLSERWAWSGAVLSLLSAATAFGFHVSGASAGFSAAGVLLLAGAVASALTALREWMARRADEERQDHETARREVAGSRLFERDGDEPDAFTFGRSRLQFDRFCLYAAGPLLALALGWAAWELRARLLVPVPAETSRLLLAAAFLGGLSFSQFLLGRMLKAMSREAGRSLLRETAAWQALGSAVLLILAAAAVVAHGGFPAAMRWAAWIAWGLLPWLAVEQVLNVVLEAYRPRRADGEPARAFVNRLGGLLGDPAGWLGGASAAVDYQFGFKISQTWLYRFLRTAVLPLLIFQVLILYLLSCIVVLGPDEEALVERMGKAKPASAGGHWGPGLHLKWPWPFETVRRHPVRRVLAFSIGYRSDSDDEPAELLWTRPHFQEEDLFLTAVDAAEAGTTAMSRLDTAQSAAPPDALVPVNLLNFNVPVEYRIRRLEDYVYRHADAEKTLRQLAYRTLTRESATRTLSDLLGGGRRTADTLRESLQREADAVRLGVTIEAVRLQGVHPPTTIADAFEAEVGAFEEREAKILDAGAYRDRVVPLAEAEADKLLYEADAYSTNRTLGARAEADQFASRRMASAAAPDIFRSRYYLDTVLSGLSGARKFIVAAGAPDEVLQFNFEDPTPAALFDFSAKGTEEKK